MKKLVLMTMAATCCMVAGVAAEARSELVATAELAPFADVTKKVNALGAMINNPIVPMLLLGSGQQQLVQSYGGFRGSSPIHMYVYLRPGALDAKDADAGELADVAVVYPSVDGAAKMALNHPGSTKEADGTLHLLAGANCPDERWVKFTADERYCAFASSAALAARAIADFAVRAGARKESAGDAPLLRLDLTEQGLSTLVALQSRLQAEQAKALKAAKSAKGAKDGLLDRVSVLQSARNERLATFLRNIAGATTVVDLNDLGLSVDVKLAAKPGARTLPAAGFQLPAGALDSVPAGASLYAAVNASLQSGHYTEAEFRAECAETARLIREDLLPEAAKAKGTKKYAPLLDELGAAVADLLSAVPCPAAGDWSVAALAFDAGKHPYLVSAGEAAKMSEAQKLVRTAADRVAAALEKQWPGRKMLVRGGDDSVTLDWGAVIDVASVESGVDAKNAKEVEKAKKTLASVLGDTKTVCTAQVEGTKAASLAARPGFKAPAAKGDAEAAFAAALPEAAKDRPAGALYFTPYAFTRDILLPVMAKFADRKDAAQYQAMIAGMAPAEPNSALAAAGWAGRDGSCRLLVRLTANEIKNLGGAFNAFTAASMSGAGDDEDDK